MAEDPGPALQRIVLGEDLRELREAAGLTSDDAAAALGWYRAKVSKVETGSAKLTDPEIEKLVTAYRVEPDRAEQLRKLAKEARRQLPPSRVPDWAAKYVTLEASAADVKLFYSDFVPGSLQTRAYAKAILDASVIVSATDVEQMADDRAKRAARFGREDGPLVWAVLGEEALRRRVGGPEVLLGQLQQLKAMTMQPNFTLQVLPLAAGAHPALGMSFSILELGQQRRTIVYMETLTGSDYLPRSNHVRTYSLVFGRLQAEALNRDESRRLIDRLIEELE
jgi:transcriptional regulator with XRE-family HTH domain